MKSELRAGSTARTLVVLVLIVFLTPLTRPALAQSEEAEKAQQKHVDESKDKAQQSHDPTNEIDEQIGAVGNQPGTPSAPGQPSDSPQQSKAEPKQSVEIYGFAMLDAIYDVNSNDPNWFDTNRPTKLPSFPGQFGRDGNTYLSVRQTRFGVKGSQPTAWGVLKVQFEFDMFGVGVDAGQTTIRPRHYWGEVGAFGAGQTNSVFMDIDVFPNTVEYWGPNGMIFFRNPQIRWMPIRGDTHLWIALERPGASADGGVIADRIELQNVRGRFQFPDLSAQYRQAFTRGYIQVAGIVRSIKIDHLPTAALNLDQSIVAWGTTLSSNLKFKRDVLRLQYVYGHGVENYMNDAPVDVAPEPNFGNPLKPFKGKALPMWSFVTYLDHSWTERWTTSIGYSQLIIQNTSLQNRSDFHKGQYGSANLLCAAFDHFMVGGEFLWGRRTNFADGFRVNDYRVQFSFKYNFDKTFEGK